MPGLSLWPHFHVTIDLCVQKDISLCVRVSRQLRSICPVSYVSVCLGGFNAPNEQRYLKLVPDAAPRRLGG